MELLNYWKQANEHLETFGAKKVSLNCQVLYGETSYMISYWKDSLDNPGSEIIFLTGFGSSFDEAMEDCKAKTLKQNAA